MIVTIGAEDEIGAHGTCLKQAGAKPKDLPVIGRFRFTQAELGLEAPRKEKGGELDATWAKPTFRRRQDAPDPCRPV